MALKGENTCGQRGHDTENASTFLIFRLYILECVQFGPMFMLYSSEKGFWLLGLIIRLIELRFLSGSHTESLLRNYAHFQIADRLGTDLFFDLTC
jgi:hypothetical protein